MDPEDIRAAGERRGPSLKVEVVLDTPEWEGIEGLEAALVHAAQAAFEAAGTGEAAGVAVALLSDAAMRELNRTFRGLDKPTNVLSFPGAPGHAGDEELRHLGDIALGSGVVASEAAARGLPLLDHVRHLAVHGLLHLLGHDHESDAEAELMEALETRILARLGVGDPYALGEDAKPQSLGSDQA